MLQGCYRGIKSALKICYWGYYRGFKVVELGLYRDLRDRQSKYQISGAERIFGKTI